MAELIMWNLMTLDGFVEGLNRDLSWHLDVRGEELERLSIDQLESAAGLMFGSRALKRPDWNNTKVFGADLPDTVARLKRESAKDILLFGSADLAASLIQQGLIDEFRIAVNPIILGGGAPLFKPGARIKLKLLDAKTLSSGIAILRYEPAK